MSKEGNPLIDYFINNNQRGIFKWLHYFDIYHRHFEPWRGKDFKLLEVGLLNGGSAQMWRDYFGPQFSYVGVDIDEACLALKEEGIDVWLGDQADPVFWDQFIATHPKLDVVIDDGGHTMAQQIVTFQKLFPILSEGGVYLCEDNHTSYMQSHGGGAPNTPGTFLDMVKHLIDDVHAWYHSSDEAIANNYCANNLYSIHVYDSIVVFEKRRKTPPFSIGTGLEGHALGKMPPVNYKWVQTVYEKE